MNVLVVGAFRSGTNLMKHLLEQAFGAKCAFNVWGWKHALAPTLLSPTGAGHLAPEMPLIVMVKPPVEQNVSLYTHWQRTRPQLLAGRDFSTFIRTELVVHDNSFGGRGPHYLFTTPTDYWNQLYYSYLSWEAMAARRQLVRLEQLEQAPLRVLARLGQAFALTLRPGHEPVIPAQKVMPSPDGRAVQLHPTEQQQRGFEVRAEDRAFIESRVAGALRAAIYGATG